MKRAPELREFADEHGLRDDLDRGPGALAAPQRGAASTGSRRPGCRPATATSRRTATGSPSTTPSTSPSSTATSPGDEPVLTRVHSECLTGDVFGSDRCDCGPQLNEAMDAIVERGPGRRDLPARPRGPGDRPGRQAAGLPAPGRRPRHGRRQPRPRPAGRRPPLRRRDPDPQRPRASAPCGCSPTTPTRSPACEEYGITVAERVAAHPAPQRPQPRLPADQARPDGPRAARTWRPRSSEPEHGGDAT